MGMIQDFQKADEERRREVKQLQDETAKRRSQVATILNDFTQRDKERASKVSGYMRSEVGKIRSEVANMLTDFAQGDAERRSAVTEYMHAEVGKIRSGVATMMKDLANGSAERATEVTTLRSEVATIHEMVWGKTPAKKVAAPVVAALPRKVPPAAAVTEQAPAGELGDKVFAYLANHPDGTRLTELEEEFGVARIQTARVIRELMDGNKVEKRDLLYFAI